MNKLTHGRRDYLTDLFLAAGYQAKTINRRGDQMLARVRHLGGAPNAPYSEQNFRIAHDQHNGDRLVKIKG